MNADMIERRILGMEIQARRVTENLRQYKRDRAIKTCSELHAALVNLRMDLESEIARGPAGSGACPAPRQGVVEHDALSGRALCGGPLKGDTSAPVRGSLPGQGRKRRIAT